MAYVGYRCFHPTWKVPWQAGVTIILAQGYPSLFAWQHSSSRLELAFGEVVTEIDCSLEFPLIISPALHCRQHPLLLCLKAYSACVRYFETLWDFGRSYLTGRETRVVWCSCTSSQTTENRGKHPGRVFLLNLQLAFMFVSRHLSDLTSTAMTIHRVMAGWSARNQFVLDILWSDEGFSF